MYVYIYICTYGYMCVYLCTYIMYVYIIVIGLHIVDNRVILCILCLQVEVQETILNKIC